MNKRILPLLFAALLMVGLFQASVVRSANTSAAYSNGLGSLGKSPLSTSVIVAQAIHEGLLTPQGNAPPAATGPDLSCTPAPCAFPNHQASEGGKPVNEDPIATDPANSKNLLTGGNDYNCGSLQGFYTSGDGGKSWSHSCMSLRCSSCSGAGDPGVGYNTRGVAYITGIDFTPVGQGIIIIENSTNNGKTWSSPTTAVTPVLGYLTDKDWLQIDDSPTSPYANSLYISVTQFSSNSNTEITVSHSRDNGTTWKTVAVSSEQSFPNVVQFSDIAVGKDGTVYASWMQCTANGPNSDCGDTVATLWISHSKDGGNTWTKPAKIGQVTLAPDACSCAFYGSLPNTNERVSEIPAIGVHGSNVYAVMYNWTGSFMKVFVATSTNKGGTWAAPVAVAPSKYTHDQFFPWLSVNSKGVVGVTWLDRRNDPSNISYETFGTYSTTSGTTFATDIKVASAASDPFNDGFSGGFMGDYTGNMWIGNHLYASWMDTRSGTDCQDEVGGILV